MISFSSLSRYAMLLYIYNVIYLIYTTAYIYTRHQALQKKSLWRPATSILVISGILFVRLPGTCAVYVETADHQRGDLLCPCEPLVKEHDTFVLAALDGIRHITLGIWWRFAVTLTWYMYYVFINLDKSRSFSSTNWRSFPWNYPNWHLKK